MKIEKPIKLTPGQWAALRWMKGQPAVLLASTNNPPYCRVWDDHKPATPASFWSLEKRGLAYRQKGCFWYLTPDGEALASGLVTP